MKNAIILHGRADPSEYYNSDYPSGSNSHWLPWLQKQLLINDMDAQTPEIFKPFESDYDKWKLEFERYHISENTILVGHSKGGGFIIRWLSEHKNRRVGKVVLVAPWLDPDGRDGAFCDFEIDEEIASRCKSLVVFCSSNDMDSVQSSVGKIRKLIKNIVIVEFENYGHFCFRDMDTDEFPELLEEILR